MMRAGRGGIACGGTRAALPILLALSIFFGAGGDRELRGQTAPAPPPAPASPDPAEPIFPFSAAPTDLILRGVDTPRAVVRIAIERPLAAAGTLVLRSPDGVELARAAVGPGEAGRVLRLPLPLPPARGVLPIDIELSEGGSVHRRRLEVTPPDPEWVIWLLPALAAEPVGFLPQVHAIETGEHSEPPRRGAIDLVAAHLAAFAADPDFRAALPSLAVLRPFLAARPWRREELLEAIASERFEIPGGSTGDIASSLVGQETMIRAGIHGTHFRREVLGVTPRIGWQLAAAGHDPAFPDLASRLGVRAIAIGRGPYLPGAGRGIAHFPSEFLWVSPGGEGILAHCSGGRAEDGYEDLSRGIELSESDPSAARVAIAELFEERRGSSLTHHVLVPVAAELAPPLSSLTGAVRDWNSTYAAPRVVVGTPSMAFAAVEGEIAARGLVPPVITRDLGSRDSGGVFSDLRGAIGAVETTLLEAETFATIAAIEGAAYPHRRLDRAWRQLFFLAHPAAAGGVVSDQTAMDLLWCARDAFETARSVRFAALCFIAARVAGEGSLVWNPLPHSREGHWLAEDVQDGQRIPHEGTLPALGVRRLDAIVPPGDPPVPDPLRPVLVNEHLRVELDLSLGGALVSVIDRATGEELLDGPANDIVVTEGVSSIAGDAGPGAAAAGSRRPGTGAEARLLSTDRDRPHRLEIEARYPEYTKRQSIELLPGARRIDFETQILRYRGRDQLLSAVFPLRHPGARPIFATASAVIGRAPAADPDEESGLAGAHLANRPPGEWLGLGRVAAVEIIPADGAAIRRPIGAGEIVIGSSASSDRQRQANALALALVNLGVTTTITREDARRQGDPAADVSLPDFRLLLGSGSELAAAAALESAWPPAGDGSGCRYVEPGSGVPGIDLPTLVLSPDPEAQRHFLASLARDRAVVLPAEAARLGPFPSAADRGFALVHHGAASSRIGRDGTIELHLLHGASRWPAGEWLDPPPRAHPDGSPLGAMHGSHRFRYSLVPHAGDHRRAEIGTQARELLHPPLRQLYRSGDGTIADGRSWLSVEPRSVAAIAFKPAGYDLARFAADEDFGRIRAVAVRLRNGSGDPVDAVIRPGFPVARAESVDLLETDGRELGIDAGGRIRVPLAPYEVFTLRLTLDEAAGAPLPLDIGAAAASPSAEWLEGRGDGNESGGELVIAVRDRELVLSPAGVETVVRIVNHHRSRPATVPLTALSPAALDVAIDPPQVVIEPRQDAEVRVRISAREAWSGRALIELSAPLGEGAVTAAVWVRDPGTPASAPPVEIIPETILVPPRGEIRAVVRNLTDGPLRGECSWITPTAAWVAIPRWREELDLPPRGEARIAVRLASPIDGFAIPRFTAGGETVWGECLALLENPSHPLLSFDVERVRIGESGIGVANLVARGLRGLSEGSEIGLRAPAGWQIEEVARAWRPPAGEDGEQRLEVSLAIAVEGGAAAGRIEAAGPGGARAIVETARVPVLRARASGSAVAIDGDLSEWDPAEFAVAEGAGGSLRLAVRYDTEGLWFAFAAADLVHQQTRSGGAIGEGDSVRIALTPGPRTAIGFSVTDLEIGAAGTPHGPQVWFWHAGPDGRPGPAPDAEVAVVASGGEVRTELRLPRSRLPGFALAPGAILGAAALWHDDDGEEARPGGGPLPATEWSGGLLGGKDASRFGEIILLER